jgi:hypothetical protein
MSATWTVRENDGQLLSHLVGGSRREVGRKIVPSPVDAFRIEVSASYREMFDRTLRQILQRNGWQIVRLKAGRPREKTRSVPAARIGTPRANSQARPHRDSLPLIASLQDVLSAQG